MAVTSGMFLFEVVVDKLNSLVDSRQLVLRSDFADVFSLDLKDPKQMHIVMPEPPPLPPQPAGKKGKKAKKPPKPKKGKKGSVPEPPPEPLIQAGQSVLICSSAEILISTMRQYPIQLSLWNKEDNITYIGATLIAWDEVFPLYLMKICQEKQIPPPVTVKDEYNIFQEDKATLMAKIGLQVKLTYLSDKVTTSFRTLTEDNVIRKVLYTGVNSKTTSFMCNVKSAETDAEERVLPEHEHIHNEYVIDKPSNRQSNKIVYAGFKNAPGADLSFFKEGDYCCRQNADKPPDSKYKSPETCPDIDFIIDYIRRIIVSCNDNLRMLTPRSDIRPRIKATDIDKLCYCQETAWPEGELAERFKKTAQADPCALCSRTGTTQPGAEAATFDAANIRGPCGFVDCKVARRLRAYIEDLVDEDNIEVNLEELVGACGSRDCTLSVKLRDFLLHRGDFAPAEATKEGFSTQCDCIRKMQNALNKTMSCTSVCSKDCVEAEEEESLCGGPACPFGKPQKNYNVFYFTIEYSFDKNPLSGSGESSPTPTLKQSTSGKVCESVASEKSEKKICSSSCPSARTEDNIVCSKTTCSVSSKVDGSTKHATPCTSATGSKSDLHKSPADSDLVMDLDEIRNPCCVKSCDVAEQVKDFIVANLNRKTTATNEKDPCYCDCVCTFQFSEKTTYCGVCGGYECLGNDVQKMPIHTQPHPCPIYHKMYDNSVFKIKSTWPADEAKKQLGQEKKKDIGKRSKTSSKMSVKSTSSMRAADREPAEKKGKQIKPAPKEQKKVGKYTANVGSEPSQTNAEVPAASYPYPQVPKNMGWNWTAEDIPGMKPRPQWKPGAVNRALLRKYRAVRGGSDLGVKKKRNLLKTKKKADLPPTLRVSKKDGDYKVEMMVFKNYPKGRCPGQYPYEDKPPLVYTIGKTEEEKAKIHKQRERTARRESRRKAKYLQSTFKDKCQEICLKAYNQAIGLEPPSNPNAPNCPCYNEDPSLSPPMKSCSCSEEGSISSSDTDNDQWEIEFTAPAGLWDPKAKMPPTMADNESQYTFLDYKVKLLDKQGNPIPRYFKSHEGKTECSDLGGFWGPGKVWLEINKDGFIGADGRFIPNNFTGPDGNKYVAEDGGFIDGTGRFIKLGVDGYIDKDLNFVWYNKRRVMAGKSPTVTAVTAATSRVDQSKTTPKAAPAKDVKSPKSDTSKSKPAAKGPSSTASPKIDKKVTLVSGKKSNIKDKVVMSVGSLIFDRYRQHQQEHVMEPISNAEQKKLAKFREIMESLSMYEDNYEMKPLTTNRASNTLWKH